MEKDSRIYIAGDRGLVGSAFKRRLGAAGYTNLITRSRDELDLADYPKVVIFFQRQRPDYVFVAAGRVGGIWANQRHPAQFIHTNLLLQTSILHAAYLSGVRRLIFFGSNCAYPKLCPQPMKEEHLLSGYLEPTSAPYAIAKLAGIKMCEAYNRQYDTSFLSVIPATLYGPNDNFDSKTSHVLTGLIGKLYEAREAGKDSVVIWGTGNQKREFLYVDDLVDACILLMQLSEETLKATLTDTNFVVNVGFGSDISVLDLASLIQEVVGYPGRIVPDPSRAEGAPRKLLDVSRISRWGWSPKVSLRDGIEQVFQGFQRLEQQSRNSVRELL